MMMHDAWGVMPGENDDPIVSVSTFDEFGHYRQPVIVQYAAYFACRDNDNDIEDVIDQSVFYALSPWYGDHVTLYTVNAHAFEVGDHGDGADADNPPPDTPCVVPKTISKWTPDYAALCPLRGWLSPTIIQKYFENTTQYYAHVTSDTLLKRNFKSPNHALNVTRCNEPVACDIVYADTPAINDGSTSGCYDLCWC